MDSSRIPIHNDTVVLLQEIYTFAHIQDGFQKQEMSLVMDWAQLRLRVEKALVREGQPLPELPDMSTVETEEV